MDIELQLLIRIKKLLEKIYTNKPINPDEFRNILNNLCKTLSSEDRY